jgi:hypothetical protein
MRRASIRPKAIHANHGSWGFVVDVGGAGIAADL